jgi:type IV secretory pathway VirB2 component (pilin)
LITLGGAVAIAGSWLPWFRVRRRLPGTPVEDVISRGVQNIDGKLTFAFAVIALIAGILIIYRATRTSYVWLGIVALISSFFVTGLSAFDSATSKDRYVDAAAAVASEKGVPTDQAVRFFRQLVDSGVVTIELRTGILLVVAGGTGILLGSVATFFSTPRRELAEPLADEEELSEETEETEPEEPEETEPEEPEETEPEATEPEGTELEGRESVADPE